MKINILDCLPKDETYMVIEDSQREALFRYTGTLTQLSKRLGIKFKNISRYHLGRRSLRLGLFLKLVELNQLNLEDFQGKIKLKVGKTGTFVKIGPTLEIDGEWVYISELIRGDGHLAKSLWTINFVNNEKTLIDFVKNFFLGVGLPRKSIYLLSRPDALFLTIRSKLFLILFNQIFDIPTGAKKEMKIPAFIKEDKNFSLSLLRGFFDSEGSLIISTNRRIVLSSNSQNYIFDCKKILNKFNIEPQIYKYENGVLSLSIGKKRDVLKFFNEVKPLHPKRIKKLKRLLETHNFNDVSSHIIGLSILKLLNINGNLRRSEISKILQQKITSLQIDYLRKNNLISVVDNFVTNKGSWFIYGITEKGKNYLKNQF